jgi:glutamate-1-semialdehyde 2,1-aminomutase
VLERQNGSAYSKIQETGSALMAGIRERAAKFGVPVVVQGDPSFFFVGFPVDGGATPEVMDYKSSLAIDNELYARFVSAMAQRGVRIIPRGNWFLSSAHSQTDVQQTLAAVDESLAEVVVPHYAAAGSAVR